MSPSHHPIVRGHHCDEVTTSCPGLALAGADPAELEDLEDMEDMREMRDYVANLDMLRDRYQLQHAAQGTILLYTRADNEPSCFVKFKISQSRREGP